MDDLLDFDTPSLLPIREMLIIGILANILEGDDDFLKVDRIIAAASSGKMSENPHASKHAEVLVSKPCLSYDMFRFYRIILCHIKKFN